jgi:uncharacterized membrane protein (DUF4010 family)
VVTGLDDDFDFAVAGDFATALMLGALVGLEREQRKKTQGSGNAGLRTFIMVAQIGAIAGYIGQGFALAWVLPAALLVTGAIVATGYVAEVRKAPGDVGLTTELAAVVTCLLGALATTGHRDLAVGLGVATAAVLAYKQPLHAMVGKLDQDDVRAGIRLLLATFIVLPLLPDQPIDPWRAIVPYKLWLLALLIAGLSLVGYVATRWLGPGRGLAVTALAGGLASSTAVTLALARLSREAGGKGGRQLAGGVLIAWTVMFVRVVVTAAIVAPALAPRLLPAFVPMAGVCALLAWLALRSGNGSGAPPPMPVKNPFSLRAGAKFALVFAVVQLLLALAQRYLPPGGTYAVAALAGLTDVDAITLAMAEDVRGDAAAMPEAVIAIAIACFANTAVKAGLASSLGRGMTRTVWTAAVAVLVVGVAGLLLGALWAPAAD